MAISPGTVDAVFDMAALTLNDNSSNPRWPKETSLLQFLNAGQKEIARIKPDVCSQNTSMELAAEAKQSLLDISGHDAVQLYALTGIIGGGALELVDARQLSAENRNWMNETGTPRYYVYDPADLLHFYVFPYPASAGTEIELIVHTNPVDVLSVADQGNGDYYGDMTLNNGGGIYVPVMVDYVLYRAFGTDADHAVNSNLSALYRSKFEQAMQLMNQREQTEDPNVQHRKPSPQLRPQ